METPLAPVAQAVSAAEGLWGGSVDVADLPAPVLVGVNDALALARRRLDAVQVRVAAEIARQSRLELGPESLAKQHGFRNAMTLVAATLECAMGEAARLIRVGEAVTPRMTFSGEAAPARHPHIAEALGAGGIGVAAADMIVTMLERVEVRAGRQACNEAERILAAQAGGLTLDQLRKVVMRAEAHLYPDGIEPKEGEARAQRTFRMFERNGMMHVSGALDPESAAPLVTVIQAIVTAGFRTGDDVAVGDDTDRDAPHRTVAQRQADALSVLAQHYLDCDHTDQPLGGATVIVRVSLDDLRSGEGAATIDGIDQPVSIGAARRMAAMDGILPVVLGGDSEVLDFGRRRRLFTPTQKLALTERDGGCAMCGAPPGLAKVHHLRWWARDHGPTDLANGVLLCEACHHRIHDNGWEIRIVGGTVAGRVWFIPPAHVDPARTPRLGGRARYDYAA